MKKRLFFLWFILAGVLFSCDNTPKQNPINDGDYDSEANEEINAWVYENMDYWYLWRDEMNSADSKDNPEVYFYNLLFHEDDVAYDKWSLIVPDYEEWIKELEGHAAATGANLILYRFDDSSDVFAIVTYVDKGSPAEAQGLKRGDAITQVNGIVPNTSNYYELFFSGGTYTYTLASITDGVVEDTGVTVTVSEEEFQKDPVLLSDVYELNGKKIGYLAYTSFLADFNDKLLNVFSDFKSAEVDELILDLRYNLGGAGTAAVRLASLIAPAAAAGNVMFRKTWNEGINSELDQLILQDESYSTMREELFEILPENLNLNKVYIITTGWSASASELVISGLQPYMDVILIGKNTHGKFTGSITLDDIDNHTWALQPIVFKYENISGYTEFWEGIPVDILADDDYQNPLGDVEENLLSIALANAAGLPAKKDNSSVLRGISVGYENALRLKGGILTDDNFKK